MQCDNCGYIFFQPSKKCACCSAPYASALSAFEIGQENLFTIFEMAPGEGGFSGGMGMAGTDAGAGDYNFTDDFDTGGTEYGVDENVLDLSEAEVEGFGPSTGSMGADDFAFDTSGMDDMPAMEDAGPDNFDLNLSDDLADNDTVSIEPEVEAGAAVDTDFGGGFDSEVEGLGFGMDESPAEEGATEDIILDAALEPELDITDEEPSVELSEELELDITDEEPSVELSEELELDIADEEPSVEYSEEPALDTDELYGGEEEPSVELPEDLDLLEEPELMDAPMEESAEMEDEGGIEFDLDSVDLDEPEEVSYEVPEAETGGEETSIDFDGLELEMEAPEEPEEEDLTR